MNKYYNWVALTRGIYFPIVLNTGVQDQGISRLDLFQGPHPCHTDGLLLRVPSQGFFLCVLPAMFGYIFS